ncbi:putative reverse transcriptase domain-containing protein [Tanacetum coccineum]
MFFSGLCLTANDIPVDLIAKTLASLTQKNQKYEWAREQEEAFQTLTDNLCNAPILSMLDGPEDFVVYCDVSNQGLAQSEAFKEENAKIEMLCRLDKLMERKEDRGMYFIWVPLIGDVRTLIMDEAHASRLVPSCFVIFDLEPLSLSFDFVFASEIFKSLSFCLDHLISLKEDLVISEFVRKSLSLILELS